MFHTKRAKLFMNGSSQAVRLPAEFRFNTTEIYITRDDKTGDVILSTHPGKNAWASFFELMQTIDVPADFMTERPMNALPVEKNLFEKDKNIPLGIEDPGF